MHQEHIDLFHSGVISSIDRVFLSAEKLELIENLYTHAKETLDSANVLFSNDDIFVNNDGLAFKYEYPKDLKEYFILLRDTSLNYLKANHLNTVGTSDLQVLKSNAYLVMKQAAHELSTINSTYLGSLDSEKEKEKRIRNWNVQNAPWNQVYQQCISLTEQIKQFTADFSVLGEASKTMESIAQLILKYTTSSEIDINEDKSAVSTSKAIIDSLSTTKKVSQIKSQTSNLDGPQKNTSFPISTFSLAVEDELEKLNSKYRYPIMTDGGELIVKELNLKTDVKYWMEAEIYPLLYEVDDILLKSHSDSSMAMVNIKNRLNLLKDDSDLEFLEQEVATLENALVNYEEKAVSTQNLFESIKGQLAVRIDDNLSMRRLFDSSRSSFDVTIENSIKSYGLRRNRYYQVAKNWILEKSSNLRDLFRNIEEEDRLNKNEKIAKYLQQIKNPERSESYANIFLTKGYIGDSFIVGRDRDLERVKNSHKQWLNGRRGGVLLSGKRMSGKSLMGYMISKHLFPKTTVILKPRRNYAVAGRPFEAGFNLDLEIKNIVKYGLRQKLMVWIDDLELWQNDKISLLTNVKSLIKAVDQYGDKLFFVLASTHWSNNQFDIHQSWKSAFQVRLNLDELAKEDVAEAIRIRHGATHKSLVENQNSNMGAYHFKRNCDRIYKQSGGTIGLALQQWANTIFDIDEKRVEQRISSKQHLPQIVDDYTGPILHALMMHKKANEYRLSKWLGARFNSLYRPITQRYLHIGLLERDLDGMLKIHSQIANDVAEELHETQWINKRF